MDVRKRGRGIAILLVSLSFAGNAHGDTIFQAGNVPQSDENIIFNQALLIGTGNPVTGATNLTGSIFQFTSNETLTTPSSGQARIEAVANPFNLLVIESPGGIGLFETAIFNLNVAVDGIVSLSAVNNFGQREGATFAVAASGSNFFTVSSDPVQSIVSITISGAFLNDVRQIRIGGAQPPLPPSAVAPEPSTVVLLVSGLAALAATRVIKGRKSRLI